MVSLVRTSFLHQLAPSCDLRLGGGGTCKFGPGFAWSSITVSTYYLSPSFFTPSKKEGCVYSRVLCTWRVWRAGLRRGRLGQQNASSPQPSSSSCSSPAPLTVTCDAVCVVVSDVMCCLGGRAGGKNGMRCCCLQGGRNGIPSRERLLVVGVDEMSFNPPFCAVINRMTSKVADAAPVSTICRRATTHACYLITQFLLMLGLDSASLSLPPVSPQLRPLKKDEQKKQAHSKEACFKPRHRLSRISAQTTLFCLFSLILLSLAYPFLLFFFFFLFSVVSRVKYSTTTSSHNRSPLHNTIFPLASFLVLFLFQKCSSAPQ